MEFRALKQEDIEAVKNDSISRGILSKQPEVIDYGYTLEHEGKILGIGGIRLINLTTCWCWFDLTHYAGEHIITVYRVIKEWTEILMKDKGIIRAQCYIEVDFPESVRMVKHLGFSYESTMPKFVGSKSAYLYVKYFGE